MSDAVVLDRSTIAAFCQRHHIRRLALFGSVLRADFGPESDIDVLVEFAAEHGVGLIGLAAIQRELSDLLGRQADVRTPGDLSRYFREDVLRTAEVLYAEG